MMNFGIKSLKDWSISYNEYTDILQIYRNQILHIPKKNLSSKRINSIYILCDKSSDLIYLVELKEAHEKIGDIDKMPKRDIIKDVKGYISNYA